MRHTLKAQLLQDVTPDDLVMMKFSSAEARTLRWERDDEFEYDDQMFDVVHTETSGDSISYWCWWDHEETHLNRQLAEMVSNALDNDTQRNDSQQHLLTYFKTLFSHLTYDRDHMAFEERILPPLTCWSVIQHDQEPPSPPPRLS